MKVIIESFVCLDQNVSWVKGIYPVKKEETAEIEFKEIVDGFREDPPEGTTILRENSMGGNGISFTVHDNNDESHEHIRTFELFDIGYLMQRK